MKKIKYQHDLLEQIEQKRKDADRQRAKDEEYDEKLTRYQSVFHSNNNDNNNFASRILFQPGKSKII